MGSQVVGLGLGWYCASEQSGSGPATSWEAGKVDCQKLALKWCPHCPTAPGESYQCALHVGIAANGATMYLQPQSLSLLTSSPIANQGYLSTATEEWEVFPKSFFFYVFCKTVDV